MFYCHMVRKQYKCRSVDIKSAFLTADLSRPVYMRCPEGHERPGQVMRLKKAMYGLCDAPRAFYLDFRGVMRNKLQCMPEDSDPCLYKSQNSKYPSVWVLQYVDDLQIAGTDADIDMFVTDLKKQYAIRDYAESQSFIGMELRRNSRSVQRDHYTGEVYGTNGGPVQSTR